jgi:ribosome biogenesis protein NSA1
LWHCDPAGWWWFGCLQAVDEDGRHLVVGSDGQQPALWELASLTKIWQAKGGKPNKIGLVDLAHTTAIAFLPGSSTTTTKSSSSSQRTVQQPAAAAAAEATGNGAGGETAPPTAAVARRFVCGSVSSKLHVYDTAVGRRPQLEVAFGETRVTSLAPEDNGEGQWQQQASHHCEQ